MKTLAETLRLDYAQFLELEVFTRFGAMVDERSRRTIEHGRRIRAILAQPQSRPLGRSPRSRCCSPPAREMLDHAPPRVPSSPSRGLGERLQEACPDVAARVAASGDLGDEDRTTLLAALDRILAEAAPAHDHTSPRPDMEKLARLRAQIASLDELRDLIRAMRALAASHVQEAQDVLAGIRRYVTVIEDAIAEVRSPGPRRRCRPRIGDRPRDAGPDR